jgi:hypothetical protein
MGVARTKAHNLTRVARRLCFCCRGLWRLYFVVIGVAVMAPTVGGAHNNSVAVMAPTVVLAAYFVVIFGLGYAY